MQYAVNFVSELLSPFKSVRLFGSSKKTSGTPEARKREEEQPLKSEEQQKEQQQSKKHKQSRLKNQISQPEKQPQPQQQQQQQRLQEQEQYKQTQQQKQQQQQQQQRLRRQPQSSSRQDTLLKFSPEELPPIPCDQQESIKNTLIQPPRSVDVPLKRQSIQRRSSDKSLRKQRRSREKPANLNIGQKIEREYIEVFDEKDHTPLVTPQERSRPSSSDFYNTQYGHYISHSDDSVVPRTPTREKRSSASFEVYSTTELRQTIYRGTLPQATADYSSRSDLASSQFRSSRSSLSQSSLSQSSLSQSSSSQSSISPKPSLELYIRNNTNENIGAFEHEGSSTSSASTDGAYRGVGSRRYGRNSYSLYVPSNRENSYYDSYDYDDGDDYDGNDDDDDDDNVPIGLSTPRRPFAQSRPLSDSLTGRTKILASSRRSSDSMLLSGVNLPPARYEQRDVKRLSTQEYHRYQQEMVNVQLKKNQEKVSRQAIANKKLSEVNNTSRSMGPTLIQMQQEYKEQLTSIVGIQNKPVSKVHGLVDGTKSNVRSKRHSTVEYSTVRRTLDEPAGVENRKRSNTVDGVIQTTIDVASKRRSYVDASASGSYSKRLGAKLMDDMGDIRPNNTASAPVLPSSKYHPNSNLQSQSLPSRHMSKQMHSITEEKHYPYYLHGKSYSESIIQKRAFPQPEGNLPAYSPLFQHSASSLSSSSSTNHSSSSGTAKKSMLRNPQSSASGLLSTGVETEKKSRRKSALK